MLIIVKFEDPERERREEADGLPDPLLALPDVGGADLLRRPDGGGGPPGGGRPARVREGAGDDSVSDEERQVMARDVAEGQ